MRVSPLFALLAAALLAGCADGGSDPDQLKLADGSTVDLGEGTSDTKGAIAGYVVDEAIRPLPGVTLTLTGGATAATDEKGFFTFALLDPGFYAVNAELAGYAIAQGSADVEAGKTATVKLQLTRSLEPVPYHETYPFEGFMQAWGTVGQWAVEIVAPTPLCQCTYTFNPSGNVTDVVLEAFWEPTVPDPAGLSEFYWEVFDEEVDYIDSGYCTSPCHAKVAMTDDDGVAFPAGEPVSVRISGPDAWLAYQQKVNVYVTVFHNGPAPEDFTVAAPA